MTTISDKFIALGTSILNLISTRASKNMDDLSEIGVQNIAALASGLPQNCVGNICVYSANEKVNGNAVDSSTTTTITSASISGHFKGVIPDGKSATGQPKNADIDSGEFTGEAVDYINLSSGNGGSQQNNRDTELILFVSSSSNGHGIFARQYAVSYVPPKPNENVIWYDLNENYLKIYITAVASSSPAWVKLGDESLYNNGTLISGAIPPVLKIGRFILNGTTMSNIIFDKSVQLLDAGTVYGALQNISEATYDATTGTLYIG